MAKKDDKWVMFRNYMVNELGITKEDIRDWIRDIVREEVKKVVSNAYEHYSIEDMIKKEIYESRIFGTARFKDSIIDATAKILAKNLEVKQKGY